MGATFRNTLGSVGTIRRWTPAAKYCYARGCICEACKYSKVFESQKKCQMKAAVMELVCKYGAPFERKNNLKEN